MCCYGSSQGQKSLYNVTVYVINALITVLFPTPAPPLKNDLKGSSLVLIECSLWEKKLLLLSIQGVHKLPVVTII